MLFGRKKAKGKPRAIAFVDFEHWYISLEKLHGTRPDPKRWLDDVSKEYDVLETYVFGDFSNPSLHAETAKIREITNCIIETGNKSNFYKKDFTDFIMLDHIYQTAIGRKDIEAYIIFSGDGHFSSVVRFLTLKQKKTVGVYGIKDAFSTQLKNTATWVKELPEEDPVLKGYYYPILNNLYRLENTTGNGKVQYPTFRLTAETVSKYYRLDYNGVKNALTALIEKGIIIQTEKSVGQKSFKILTVNWKKAENSGIWQK